LVLTPSHHDRTIIDAIDDYFSDAFGFQFSFLVQITRNLLSGSGRGKSPRQANQDHPFALHAFCKVSFFWGPTNIEVDGRRPFAPDR
jgi:hypothetical protein